MSHSMAAVFFPPWLDCIGTGTLARRSCEIQNTFPPFLFLSKPSQKIYGLFKKDREFKLIRFLMLHCKRVRTVLGPEL